MRLDHSDAGTAGVAERERPRQRKAPAAPGRLIAQKLLEAAGAPPIRIRLWDGSEVGVAAAEPVATLRLAHLRALLRLAAYPELYFGELYMTGELEVEGDLVRCLEALYRARNTTGSIAVRPGPLRRALSRRPRNTLAGSRSNIHHHYDLGNDFYRLWLDSAAMQYTCAYFPHAEATLEEAQVAKMEHVCRKLRLKPGDRVVEAGCGWGGLARYMAREHGARVRAFNISTEQVRFAREQAQAEGLAERVEYVEDDYRNVSGDCDVFVSVGMLEHVGVEHYTDLAEAIDRVLKPDGRGLIHSIGRNRSMGGMNAWINKRIFPGAHPPTLREMMTIFEHGPFSVQDVENLRLHYAATLRHWLARYEQHYETVEGMFDASFARAWRLYLSGSVAAFTTGNLQLFQVVFNRATCNDLPLTREHIYAAQDRH